MTHKTRTWPVLLLCLPAFVAIWGGWVGLGELTGFGVVNLLPGMVPDGGVATVNTAVTLPIGLETYAAYALHAALNATKAGQLRRFATWSAVAALVLGGLGQVAYHMLSAFGIERAPWWITAIVATLPVGVLGMGTALAALIRREAPETQPETQEVPVPDEVPDLTPVPDEVSVPTLVPDEVPILAPVRTARVRKEWDPAKVFRLTQDFAKDQDVADLVEVGTKTVQRVRRAGRLLKDLAGVSDQDVATTCKLTAAQVAAIRKEALPA